MSLLLSCILFQVDQSKARQANQNAHHFIPGDGFVIKAVTHENQDDSENGGLHDLCDAYGPAGFIGVDEAHFKTNYNKAENDGGPVQLFEFCKQAAGFSQNKIENEGCRCADGVSDGESCKGVHSLGYGLGTNLIDDVTGDNQGHGPNVSEHGGEYRKKILFTFSIFLQGVF